MLYGAICYKVDIKGEPFNINIAPSPNVALDKYVEKLQTYTFNCRLHSILTFELLQAAGIEARFITCMPEDRYDNDCHVVNHVWLPELEKWAMIDSDSGGNWASDSTGTPLSIPELRDYYIQEKNIYFHPGFGVSSCEKNHYYGYMAKNTFWFSSWETHQFSQEPSEGRNVGRYISLVPKGYEPFGLNKADIVIHNAEQFWMKPLTKSK